MARVYLAVQKKFGRLVALKVMSADYSKDPNFRKRFVRESRINAQLSGVGFDRSFRVSQRLRSSRQQSNACAVSVERLRHRQAKT